AEIGISEHCSDDDIPKTIVIHIPGTAHGNAGIIIGQSAANAETIGAVQRGDVEHGWKGVLASEDHVGGSGIRAVGRSLGSADDDIADVVAIDVAGASHRGTQE